MKKLFMRSVWVALVFTVMLMADSVQDAVRYQKANQLLQTMILKNQSLSGIQLRALFRDGQMEYCNPKKDNGLQ